MIHDNIGVPDFRKRTVKGLVIPRPLKDVVKVATHVNGVEDWEDVQVLPFPLDPTLAERADVTRALKLLPDDVHAVVCWRVSFASVTTARHNLPT